MMTLAREAVLEGVGVHSGKPSRLRLIPSAAGRIVFRRADLGRESVLDPRKTEAKNASCFRDGDFEILTLEHLLAALYALGVGSLDVELNAAEVPIMDGSAAPFVRAVERAGLRPLGVIWVPIDIREEGRVEDGDASVVFEPNAGLKVSYEIEYAHPAVGRQAVSLEIDAATFAAEVAPARTYGFISDLERFRSLGLALGSSLENTIGLDDEKVVNPPLRFPDEFVRHKVLDLVGDLALLGRPVRGHFRARRAGHVLHQKVVRSLLNRV
ncbi:MAG: UDP-3-O-[3-hydroxymyristoyl] N-acetylglucosamine deacetylase [Candidatus Aminicenantes bacterium]|nr:UDP-3-O-[3-hydroxymyristoyl] N-acetylglucosamine deacetylase [Candidatus Aminicenantes bacterium]